MIDSQTAFVQFPVYCMRVSLWDNQVIDGKRPRDTIIEYNVSLMAKVWKLKILTRAGKQ